MSARDEEFDAQLAERGDDRPGLDDLDDADDIDGLVDDSEDGEAEDADELDSDDDSDDDYPEDATEDDIDCVVALYREDGRPSGLAMPLDLANDFDEFIEQLRRVPGDAGALGVVVLDSDVFVLVRVRGKKVQALLSDVVASLDWPIARDVVDFLGEDLPDADDDDYAVGDFDMFEDAGVPEFEMEQFTADLDADPIETVTTIVKKLGFASVFTRTLQTFDE